MPPEEASNSTKLFSVHRSNIEAICCGFALMMAASLTFSSGIKSSARFDRLEDIVLAG